jgi:hypothetical protein
MNKYKQALVKISHFDVPPADNSCCYEMQRAVYDIKDIAEAAIGKQRKSQQTQKFCSWQWKCIVDKIFGRC